MDDNANALPVKASDPGEQTRDLLQELIDSAYETALTPAQYDRFMDNWNAYMTGLLSGMREGVDETPALTPAVDDPAVARHFARASAILQRMVVVERPATAEVVAGSDERSAIVLSPAGRILAANVAVRAEFGERIDAADLAERMEVGGFARLREGLQHIQRIGLAAAPVVLRLTRADGERDYFVLTPVQVQSVDTPCGVLRALQLNWTREFEAIVRETFALTARETAIVRDLARGATLERVAETGGAALATVRTQMKSIYAKTGVTSQPALVRLFTGL
nr:LuxR C-terminal-related transcriptional regulator [Rhizobiaceae bacterium]